MGHLIYIGEKNKKTIASLQQIFQRFYFSGLHLFSPQVNLAAGHIYQSTEFTPLFISQIQCNTFSEV